MSWKKPWEPTDPIDRYIAEHSLRFTAEQLELIAYTEALPDDISRMIGSLDGAQFFQVLIQLIDCKRCIEGGIFTGYTTLAMALALPSNGKLIACDIDDQYVRQDLWNKAGVHDKIDLQIGPALETLNKLLQLVRSNGLIVIDNTL